MSSRAPLAGKVALVTGAGGGLGDATCAALAAAGARIVAADIRLGCAQDVVAKVEAAGGAAIALRLDVTSAEQAREAVRSACETFGSLDVLVNNAGVDVTAPLADLDIQDWERVRGVNLDGPFHMSKAALPALCAARGHIVNVVSTAAKRAWPNAAAYHASKWGLLGFSHALHAELRPAGVKVTAIVAGGMRTPFLTDRFPDIDLDTLQDPRNVARTIEYVLTLPPETVIAEMMVLPMGETSWP